MIKLWLASAFCLALSAASGLAQPALTIDADPALAAWTTPEFHAFTSATGIQIHETSTTGHADILIAPAPAAQIAEHDKLTLPYRPRDTSHIPATLKDDDGDWTAVAITYLAFTRTAPPNPTAETARRILLLHMNAARPDAAAILAMTPTLLISLAPSPSTAITFPTPQTIIVPYFIARLKTGKNPEAAARLIDFLLAAPAQSQLPVLAWALPARTDIAPASTPFKTLDNMLKHVSVYTPNWHQVRRDLAD